jgi:hypothetical protein
MIATLTFYRGDEKLFAEIDFDAPPVVMDTITIFDKHGQKRTDVEISEQLNAMMIEACWKQLDDEGYWKERFK